MASDRMYKQSEAVLTRVEEEGEVVVFHTETGRIHLLNSTGQCLWQWCEEGATEDHLLASLAEAFPKEPAGQLAEDVKAFLGDMVERQLLTVCEPEAVQRATL
jgi:PqqD family protein of HPr-rel-A system